MNVRDVFGDENVVDGLGQREDDQQLKDKEKVFEKVFLMCTKHGTSTVLGWQ